MRQLLDTHLLIWSLSEPDRLSKAAAARILDPQQELVFSAASIWEIGIKFALNRADFLVNPAEILAAAITSGYEALPVFPEAAAMAGELPMHHRDPFDRLLIAQAVCEQATLLTVDAALAPYSEHVVVLPSRPRRSP